MAEISAIRRMLRGEIGASAAAVEAVRRINSGLLRRRERRQLAQLDRRPARLLPEFAHLPRADLLAHFRSRESPKFFAGFADAATTARLQSELFPEETKRLLDDAERIAAEHCWPLLGFGERCFGPDEINWNRDPLSGFDWPLDYHGDINLFRNDGSDARVLWELNRFSHLITLARAYALTGDEKFTTEFLRQVRSWRSANPIARGVNWACAMEVALRATNLLAAFTLFLRSPQIEEGALAELLMIFDQHGAHIRRNLEYSHIATGNHYMCDVAGLLWLGVMFPELLEARAWREFGLRELLNELDKQILPDGADSESSTGYHRLKLELLLYSFVLCRENGVEIDQKNWQKLRAMADYTRAYLLPDGRAPLIGDSDSGQVLPIVKRAADDHAYLLALAAAVFHEPRFGTHACGVQHAGGMRTVPEELPWILGEQGMRDYEALPSAPPTQSRSFPDAGLYVLREDDLYLLFNASGCGLKGRGSHGHNDALSIEVSACGTPFIVDPGSYVYTADLHERHLFRSTAYHSTVQVDDLEQNSTDEHAPFVIGDEAHPRVLTWETNAQFDFVVAEHNGYQRLTQPVTHRRAVRFHKRNKFWLIEDGLIGRGEHAFAVRFHFASGLKSSIRTDRTVEVYDKMSGARLLIVGSGLNVEPTMKALFVSGDYGSKQPSWAVCWRVRATPPINAQFALIPVRHDEDLNGRLEVASAQIGNRRSAI